MQADCSSHFVFRPVEDRDAIGRRRLAAMARPTRDCRVPEANPRRPRCHRISTRSGKFLSRRIFLTCGRQWPAGLPGRKRQTEVAHLIEAKTGKGIWNVPLADRYEDEWGAGPRSTPLIDGDASMRSPATASFAAQHCGRKVIWGASFDKDFGVKFLGSKANSGTATRRGNSVLPRG